MNNRRRTAWFRRGTAILEDYEQLPTVFSGSTKWWGGCYFANKIYACPRDSSSFLIHDTITDIPTLVPAPSGSSKWIGCNPSPDGKIFYWPDSRNTFAVLDPVDNSYIEVAFPTGGSGVNGAVLAQNGKFYTCPRHSSSIYEVDPVTLTYSIVASVVGGVNKWRGAFLGENGKIYFVPSSNTNWCEFDPVTYSVSYFASGATGAPIAQSVILAQNGFGYSIPGSFDRVIKFDPATGISTFISGVFPGASKWIGGTLAPNQKIFGAPTGKSTLLSVDTLIDFATEIILPFTPGSQAGLVLARNGSVYSIPYSGLQMFKIKNVGVVTDDMVTIPSDLADLPMSIYNKYQNKAF